MAKGQPPGAQGGMLYHQFTIHRPHRQPISLSFEQREATVQLASRRSCTFHTHAHFPQWAG
jgi:hypothetical protein